MDNTNRTEQTILKDVVGSFVGSYVERDKSIDFAAWLAGRLQEEVLNMPNDASEKLSMEIIAAVAEYDRTLNNLDKAIEAGQSKESWLTDRIAETYTCMPMDEAGVRLVQLENDLNISNAQLMLEALGTPESESTPVATEVVDWNEYSLKNKALEVGKQAVMLGVGAAAATLKKNVESSKISDISGVVGQVLQDGVETASGEVKAVVAGAIKTAVENKLTDVLPEDTPMGTICDIACVAVEGADALFDVAKGKKTMTEALDKAGRAGVAAGCRMGANVLKGKMACIPVVGPLVVDLAGGLLDHMNSTKFSENVYPVVRDAAIAAWEGIKASRLVKTLNGLKNTVKQMLFN